MIPRPALVQALQHFLDTPAPAVALLSGPPRCGKSHLVRSVLGGRRTVWVRGDRLPAPLMAAELEVALRDQFGTELAAVGGDDLGSAPPSTPWGRAFALLHALSRLPHPPVLVLDAADPLLEDRRFLRELEGLGAELRAHARRLHILAVVRDPSLPAPLGLPAPGGEGAALGLDAVHISVPFLGLREAAARVPGWDPEEVVTLFALVGGVPDFWARVDPGVRPATNLSRLLLAADAPLRWLPDALVPGGALNSERALALVRALARGARSWGELRGDAAVFRSSSELGPYVKGLLEAGMVEASVSLDAGPRSRNRRYALTHPLLAFWYGSVHPRLAEIEGGAPPHRVLAERLAPELQGLLARRLPGIVRRYLLEQGHERLPGRAREAGAAWGPGYDLDVAGTLVSGAAVYGKVIWGGAPPESDALDALGAEIRATRYGFGREARLRLLILREEPPHEIARRAAKLPEAFLLGPRDLVGRG